MKLDRKYKGVQDNESVKQQQMYFVHLLRVAEK